MADNDNKDIDAIVAAWLALLRSDEDGDRSEAADNPPDEAPDDVVVEGLLSCLDDPDELVRISAIDSLRNCHFDDVRAGLKDHLGRVSDPMETSFTLSALGYVGTLDDLVLLERYVDPAQNARVALGAADGLVFCATRHVTRFLITLLQENPDDVRHPTVNVCRYIAEMQIEQMKAVLELLESLDVPANEGGLRSTIDNAVESIRGGLHDL